MGPNLTDIFAGHEAEQFVKQFNGPMPEPFGCYIPYILDGIDFLGFHLTLNFALEIFDTSVSYFNSQHFQP